MKKLCSGISAIALVVLMNSCNSGEKTEVKTEETTTTPTTVEQPATPPPPKDTPRTTISVGSEGAEIKTKEGTNVKVNSQGGTVGTKDVKVEVKP